MPSSVERIDAHRDHDAGRPPRGIEIGRERARRRAQRRRREILELVDQDVGAASGALCSTASLAPSRNSQERQRLRWPDRLLAQAQLARSAHWNVMSTHLETSEPRPEAMVMQPRTFCVVLSLAHTA